MLPRLPTAALLCAFGLVGCAEDGGGGSDWHEAGSVGIDEDQFIHFDIQVNRLATLSFTVTVSSGPNIDFFTLDDLNFQQYTNQNSYTYRPACSRAPVNSGNGSCSVDQGIWHLVLDNTDRGEAVPPVNFVNDPAFVTYSFSLD